jgi:hypothetical protein
VPRSRGPGVLGAGLRRSSFGKGRLRLALSLACLHSLLAATAIRAQDLELETMVITAQAPVYQDQYLLEGSERVGLATVPLDARLLGRRELELETVYYRNQDDYFGDEVESGLSIRWLRETGNFGTFDLQAQMSDVDSSFHGREVQGSDSLLTFRQSALAVSASSLLDTAVGHQRVSVDSLLHTGYRFRLPSSTILGVTTEMSGEGRRLRFTNGKIGRYRGVRLPGFEDTGGRLTSVAYEMQATDRLELGTELIDVSGDDDIRDHTSLILGMRHTTDDETREHAARLIRDSDGNIGLWSDSRQDLGSSRLLRYGIYRLDPELAWADQPTMNDQQGAYVRLSSSRSILSLAGGYDWLQSGLRSSASSVSSHSVFFNSSVRVRRDLRFGVTASVGSRALSALPGRQPIRRLRGFSNWTIPAGSFLFEIFDDTIGGQVDTNDRSREGVATTFNWRMPERIRLSTELRLERDDGEGDRFRRQELSTLFRYDIIDNVSMGINASVYRSSGSLLAGDDGFSLGADVDWRFRPDWNAGLTVSHNRTHYGLDDSLLAPGFDEAGTLGVWLSIRYARRAGRAFPSFGANPAGAVGSGRLSGTVFFDENGDGIRQPSEEVAAGVVVILDGRYETRTNSQGTYSFSPVPAGAHTVMILVEELPLPWGLDDERPREREVRFRQGTDIDFPLTIIQ